MNWLKLQGWSLPDQVYSRLIFVAVPLMEDTRVMDKDKYEKQYKRKDQ